MDGWSSAFRPALGGPNPHQWPYSYACTRCMSETPSCTSRDVQYDRALGRYILMAVNLNVAEERGDGRLGQENQRLVRGAERHGAGRRWKDKLERRSSPIRGSSLQTICSVADDVQSPVSHAACNEYKTTDKTDD